MGQKQQIKNRVEKALHFFESGYNCSQAVFMAYADKYDIDSETAARFASSFGGGMGRLGETCGAVTGMFMILSQHYPATDLSDKKAKMTNYDAVRRTAHEFQQEMGSYTCADLLQNKKQSANPASERNIRYAQLRPCGKCVAIAAEIVGEEVLRGVSSDVQEIKEQ